MSFTLPVETLDKFNADLYAKENKGGARGAFFENFGGIEALESTFQTSLEEGVEKSEAEETNLGEPAPFFKRREYFGTNDMPKPKKKWLITMIWEHCQDSTIIILALAAVVSLALGLAFPEQFFDSTCQCVVTDGTAWVEGVAILVAVVIIVMVGSLQDYDKELKFRALGTEDKRFIKVIRGGNIEEVRTNELVVGDVVVLEWGKFVPADGYLISGDQLKIDESSVTGEAEPVSKSFSDPWLMSNCSVTQGSGRMLVGAVGKRTEWGRTLMGLQEQEFEETPLQKDLGKIVIGISLFGGFFGVITFFVLAIYWAIDTATLMTTTAWSDTYIRGIVDALIIGITLLVVGIPEGLPLAVIISLAYSMKAMTKDNNLVRHLQAVRKDSFLKNYEYLLIC